MKSNEMPSPEPASRPAKRGACCFVLGERERELLEIKGPCSNKSCRLHYAHSGPCDTRSGGAA